jgi:hypothetical protein
VFPVSRTIDRNDASFDHDGLISIAGLIVIATPMSRFGLERVTNTWVRTGSHAPGHKICTLIASMLAGATHGYPRCLGDHPRRDTCGDW